MVLKVAPPRDRALEVAPPRDGVVTPADLFATVRERIVAGALPADRAIRQDALAAELGVSKIPLREALARLAQEGLLVAHPNRGFFVPPLALAEAEEIFALRLAIEPDALAAAAAAATPADHAAARSALAALDRAAAAHAADVGMRNRAFHMALVRPAGKPHTVALVERLQLLAERYVHAHLAPIGRDDRAHGEHATLLAAWTAADAPSARALAADHVAATLADLRRQLAP